MAMRLKKYIITVLFCTIALLFIFCTNKTSAQNSQLPALPSNWNVTSPAAEGLSESAINSTDVFIKNNYPNLYSIIIVRHGNIAYERYYNGGSQNTYQPLYSVTKTFTSALMGIAIDERRIISPNQTVFEFLPQYFSNTNLDKKGITLWNGLTMSAGLEASGNGNDGMYPSQDWIKYALDRPLNNTPGTVFEYNTGLTQVLSGVLEKETGMSESQYAVNRLFGPLGITNFHWGTDTQGHTIGGFGLSLTSRDMAKFGQLYLQKGVWRGQRIVSSQWVEDSFKKHINVVNELYYGYMWWITTKHDATHNRDFTVPLASGAYGQIIAVLPDLDMVVVLSANSQVQSVDGTSTEDLIAKYILPAVEP
jgi:CubicO group peptidase (beta-lactamase class C family)